ncbi:hypothetical protein BABINDRAFT_8541 [Babjeviella inositovora NRRL Y-12698]|uniref:Fe2OG dioxygenase domain-containing protein n=1 Tax=Babjeviella inositovora NRRL Y-12698 TaxID=984486 RepID=A0A1E3QPR4_9ASCO|nr:uncharacterized protein BABINDRAFT_8541 [Babjeviella inositovora NRRL Y-12698]ODQ79640.1 hypothetical protein BABINDRAFT_8541 [Babjeviella inositovora NRRL Y-12698]
MAVKKKGTDSPTPEKYDFPKSFLVLSTQKSYFTPTPETVVDGQIITIPKFFNAELCDELIASFTTSPSLTLETTPLIKGKGYAARVNDRALTNDPVAAQSLWAYLSKLLQLQYGDEAISSIFDDAIGLNPQLRIYRYRAGHHFGKHYDESVPVTVERVRGETRWTLLIYLTGDEEFVGGGTIFYPPSSTKRNARSLNIHPSKGMALLHKHGDDCLLHEGELVSQGEKWILRSDIVYPW